MCRSTNRIFFFCVQEQVSSIRDYFFGFMKFGPVENRHAYDISFGTIGYSLILARAFREVGRALVFGVKLHCDLFHSVVCTQVISVNFHPFYRNAKQVCRKDTFLTNYITITFQDDIFTQNTDNILMVCTYPSHALEDFIYICTPRGLHVHGLRESA